MDLVHLSVAMSLDGHIDGAAERLVLSGPEDLRAVHAARAACDAILVGAGTVRRDDPRLTVRFPDLARERQRAGLPESPLRVTLTGSGDLDPACAFFTGPGRGLVLCPAAAAGRVRDRLGTVADILVLDRVDAPGILAALSGAGVRRLFVEGGTAILTLFLKSGCFHRLRLAVAPFLVGESGAPRLVGAGPFAHHAGNRLRILSAGTQGGVAVIEMENPRFGVAAGMLSPPG